MDGVGHSLGSSLKDGVPNSCCACWLLVATAVSFFADSPFSWEMIPLPEGCHTEQQYDSLVLRQDQSYGAILALELLGGSSGVSHQLKS